jgi:hypothetical protein
MIPPLARRTWPLTQPPSRPARNDTTAAMSAGRPRRSRGRAWRDARGPLGASLEEQVGRGRTRGDRVGAYLAPPKFLVWDAGQRLDRGLGRDVRPAGREQQGDLAGREVDDPPAAAAPIPLDAPVTMATLPVESLIVVRHELRGEKRPGRPRDRRPRLEWQQSCRTPRTLTCTAAHCRIGTFAHAGAGGHGLGWRTLRPTRPELYPAGPFSLQDCRTIP